MKLIGLTGGIGSGKSTVSNYLKEKGCFVIDTDQMSRDMTKKGSPVLNEIRKAFGDNYFSDEGDFLRKEMAKLIFNDPSQKEKLEKIVTAQVIDETRYIISQLKAAGFLGLVIVDAPLLFECGLYMDNDENWLVSCDLDVRIKRVMERDNSSREAVLDRISNQMSEEEKRTLADVIIDNSLDLDHLYRQLDELIGKELSISDEESIQ